MGDGETRYSKDRKSNEQIEANKITSNENVASQNLEFQRENLAWQKAVQEEEWNREDSTYQRTVADARAAGVSPLALQGLNDSGEIVPTEALHNDMHYDQKGLFNRGEEGEAILNAVQSSIAQMANLASTTSQLYSQNLANEQQRLQNQYLAQTLDNRVSAQTYDTQSKKYGVDINYANAADAMRREHHNAAFGFFNGMSDGEKAFQLAAKKMGFVSPDPFHQQTVYYDKDGRYSDSTSYNLVNYNNPASYATMMLSAMATDKLMEYASSLLKGKTNITTNDYSNHTENKNEYYHQKNQWNGFNK